MLFRDREAQALEGHGNPGDKALLGKLAARFPNRIPGVVILIARTLRPQAIHLVAVGVHGEHVSAPAVVVSVEEEIHLVIPRHIVAGSPMTAHLARFVVKRHNDAIEIPVVITQVGFRLLRRGLAVTGQALDEVIDLGQLAFPLRAGPHFEEIFEPGRFCDPRHGEYDVGVGGISTGCCGRQGEKHPHEPHRVPASQTGPAPR